MGRNEKRTQVSDFLFLLPSGLVIIVLEIGENGLFTSPQLY